jgi:hypothetical protein
MEYTNALAAIFLHNIDVTARSAIHSHALTVGARHRADDNDYFMATNDGPRLCSTQFRV